MHPWRPVRARFSISSSIFCRSCDRSIWALGGMLAICPGFFPSKMSRGLLEVIGDDVIAHTPLGRLGGEEDLKGIAAFFASEASRHVTGQYIAVDGGASL